MRKGTTIARKDKVAHYLVGTMELVGRIGSHQQLGEACDEDNRVEGWLVGRGEPPVAGYTLRAVIVAKAQLGIALMPFADTTINRITGTLIKGP